MDESVQKHLKPGLDDADKILLRTADYIEEHGLSCGGGFDAQGRMCVIVTMGKLIRHRWDGAGNEALDRLRGSLDILGIASWSDHTPAERVVAKLRAVALGG